MNKNIFNVKKPEIYSTKNENTINNSRADKIDIDSYSKCSDGILKLLLLMTENIHESQYKLVIEDFIKYLIIDLFL